MFLLVIGGGALLLFVVSDIADKTDYDFLFTSLIFIGIGWAMWRKKPEPPSAGRFAWFNKWNGERRKKREEKSKSKQEKK